MTANYIRLHQHINRIALCFEGQKETVYITPELAEKLANELKTASVQVKNGYHYETKEINVNG